MIALARLQLKCDCAFYILNPKALKMLIDFDHIPIVNGRLKKYFQPVFRKNFFLFLLGLSITVGDSKLIFATAIFIVSLLVGYQLQNRSTTPYLNYIRQLFHSDHQKLFTTVTIAGLISFVSYFCLNIYSDLDSSWLALTLTVQTLFSSVGIAFLTKKLFSSSSSFSSSTTILSFEQLIPQLQHESPLHRLWVINQIMNLWANHQLDKRQIEQLEEYLILWKNLELEPVILAKIDRSLETIYRSNSQPLKIVSGKKILTKNEPLPVMQTVNSTINKSH